MPNVAAINAHTSDDAIAAFLRCCGSTRWAKTMNARRPFTSSESLFTAATEIDCELTRADWLEAFAAHPRIGDVDTLRKKFASTAHLCEGEQSGVLGASEDVLERLSAGNRRYEDRFGYIFIVCATGKSANEMLALLESRLPNDPLTELTIAAGEQAKITRLRLEKL
ncbi:2-oxo-4-hydroxy-4-carboxy-5-ureidoimidazoline decarboxylase [soil metagenome]